ncbi:MAG: nucleotide sugar dehydrogenase [Chloroflexi bacterium OHK40]
MQISIFGLGYVGTVTAACLAARGHRVIGVDVAAGKVELLNKGRSPIVEPGLDALVADVRARELIEATTDVAAAVAATDLALICVGTPSLERGGLDVQYVERVMDQIGAALMGRARPFLIVLRSTVLPGTTRQCVLPTLERASGRPLGDGYEVLYHPEFLREGSSLRDFDQPALIVIGEARPGTAGPLIDLYGGVEAPRFVTSLEGAEMIKYANNAFHAVKITFANEIGQLCQSVGVDSHEVMEMFVADRQLNISPAYLRPGFAFGGSCLPKDLRALTRFARHQDLSLPLLESALPSNGLQIERALQRVEAHRRQRIGMVGLAFKPHTDDLRESPLVILAERLLGKGYALSIYDPQVQLAALVGGNLAYVQERLPHLSRLLLPGLADLAACELIVIGHPLAEPAVIEHWLTSGIQVLDLVGRGTRLAHPNYEGLYW